MARAARSAGGPSGSTSLKSHSPSPRISASLAGSPPPPPSAFGVGVVVVLRDDSEPASEEQTQHAESAAGVGLRRSILVEKLVAHLGALDRSEAEGVAAAERARGVGGRQEQQRARERRGVEP